MAEGRKSDTEKNRLDLIPPAATEGIGLVLTFGAKKYDAYNWANGIAYSRIIGAIKRHLLDFENGEDVDPESGLLHVDHIACNVAFLQTYQRYPGKYAKFDDRYNYAEKLQTVPGYGGDVKQRSCGDCKFVSSSSNGSTCKSCFGTSEHKNWEPK